MTSECIVMRNHVYLTIVIKNKYTIEFNVLYHYHNVKQMFTIFHHFEMQQCSQTKLRLNITKKKAGFYSVALKSYCFACGYVC